jgi:prepilin-type N-terminal cleavage/methylation domain-containing protein
MAKRSGFSLVEAAVALAVMAILAGTLAPVTLRVLNQRRAAATRRNLKAAFEALFGSRDRRVPNLRADLGFNPAASLPTLDILVAAPGGVPPFAQQGGTAFAWGYNGPYWQGPVQGRHPVDGWGNPIDLICKQGPAGVTWQVHSPGPDRAVGADDLYYPPQAALESAYRGTLLVVVTKMSPDIAGTLTLRHPSISGQLAERQERLDPAKAFQSFTFTPPAGGMELVFAPRQQGFKPFTIPMDLLPGLTREVQVSL